MHKNTAYFKVHFELDYLHTWVHLNRNEGLVDLRRPIQVLRTNNSYHHSRYRFFGATKFEINQMKVNYWLYHILMFYADKIVYSLYAFSQYIYPKIIFFTNCTILQFIYLQQNSKNITMESPGLKLTQGSHYFITGTMAY